MIVIILAILTDILHSDAGVKGNINAIGNNIRKPVYDCISV